MIPSSVPNQFSHRTLIGNWFEDQTLYEHKVQEYLERKKRTEEAAAAEAARGTVDPSKLAAGTVLSNGATKLTYRKDGTIKAGDAIMIASIGTSGLLTVDMGGAFCSTTANKGPVPANTFLIHPAGAEGDAQGQGSSEIAFGNPLRIVMHPRALGQEGGGADARRQPGAQYLASVPVALTTSLQHRKQKLILTDDPSADTLWVIEPLDVEARLKLDGEPVRGEVGVVIRHVATGHALSSDTVVRSAGPWPVDVHSAKPVGRRHALYHELLGTAVPDVSRFAESAGNGWTLLMSSRP